MHVLWLQSMHAVLAVIDLCSFATVYARSMSTVHVCTRAYVERRVITPTISRTDTRVSYLKRTHAFWEKSVLRSSRPHLFLSVSTVPST